MRFKKGSSLIVVLLVIAGVITVTVGAQRVVLVQFAQSNQASDNTYAYNAAKAGIEDGLVRFRYNRNTETALAANNDQLSYRYDLTAGAKANNTDANGELDPKTYPTPDTSADQVYDLSMNFKADHIGDVNTTTGAVAFSNNNKIDQDGFLELTGFSSSSV